MRAPSVSGCACSAAARRTTRVAAIDRLRRATSSRPGRRRPPRLGVQPWAASGFLLAWNSRCADEPSLQRSIAACAGEIGEFETAALQRSPPSARSTRQPARASPGSLPPATARWSRPSRLVSVASISGSAPIGRITSATARVDAQANWLNATTCAVAKRLHRQRLVGEIQARLDAVDHIGRARVRATSPAHRASPAARPGAPGRRAFAPCGIRHSAALLACCEIARRGADRAGMRRRLRRHRPTITTALLAPPSFEPCRARRPCATAPRSACWRSRRRSRNRPD